MKKGLLKLSLIFAVAIMMTSCYTFTATVGNGPQTGTAAERVFQSPHHCCSGPLLDENMCTDYYVHSHHLKKEKENTHTNFSPTKR